MKVVFDRATKKYLTSMAVFAVLLLCAAALLCAFNTNALKNALLENDRALASALLAQGVPKTQVAAAFTETEITDEGAALIESIGLSSNSSIGHFSRGGDYTVSALIPTILLTVILVAAAGFLTLRFFRKREELFKDCAATMERFLDGDYSGRLPRAREGGLYSMLSSADNLAMTLESRGESERRAKESLREVISDVSHQLKTPLAALRLYNELMAQSADSAQAVRDFTAKAILSTDRIEGLIQTLLKVMRLDTGNVEFHKESCRVCDLAAEATRELLTRAAVEGKTIKIEGSEADELNCDPQWTAEALMNLVKNALDYTARGGNVTVSWARAPGMLRITVTDDGCGIAPEDMPLLFKRFYRSGKSRDIQGVGLGLPLAKSVAEGQGGMLSVKSQPECGSEFTMSFLTEM